MMTRVEALAALFRSRPGVWFDGRDLAGIAGSYAWRTRVSELRRAPYLLNIVNRQRHGARPDGRKYVISEYCFVPVKSLRQMTLLDEAAGSPCPSMRSDGYAR